ncbi:ribonuclease H-like domain-containing protein [Tanacetum coccineum]
MMEMRSSLPNPRATSSTCIEYDHTSQHDTEYDLMGQHDTEYDHTGQNDTEYDHRYPHDTEYDNMRQHDTEYDHMGQHDTEYDHTDQDDTEYDNIRQDDSEYDHTGQHDTEYDHTGLRDTEYDNMSQHNTEYDHMGQHDTKLLEYILLEYILYVQCNRPIGPSPVCIASRAHSLEVIVENGSSIPVTHSGHVKIPNPYRPLHLKNVLVTPNINKNLITVQKFTTNNKCSIDFDPYGFTVRDYHTRQTLLRCDSMGYLYPLHVAASAFALLTNNHSLWHQRLGHSGDAITIHIFYGSTHFTEKFDAQSKLLHFHAFIKTQFNCEIKAFQCDHGGEFDNNSLHELFATNGIQFRFSCPRTSQQNGKSERMIRTINNVVRSLLFQAILPPEYWVEALLTATYLLNILPSTSINNDIPYTKLFNKPTSYTHIQLIRIMFAFCRSRFMALSRPLELGFSDFSAMLFEPVSITAKPTRLFSSFTKGQTQLTYYYMWMISFLQLLLLRSCNVSSLRYMRNLL